MTIDSDNLLKDKAILVVDDEVDVLDAVGEMLDTSMLHKAGDYDAARQHLLSYSYDIVILDIMGVRGFELLEISVRRGFPTVMFTAHSMTQEALKISIRLGAVSFLPKDKIDELQPFLCEVVLGGGKPIWKKVFDRLGTYFDSRFGADWEEKDKFFKEFQEALKQNEDKKQ